MCPQSRFLRADSVPARYPAKRRYAGCADRASCNPPAADGGAAIAACVVPVLQRVVSRATRVGNRLVRREARQRPDYPAVGSASARLPLRAWPGRSPRPEACCTWMAGSHDYPATKRKAQKSSRCHQQSADRPRMSDPVLNRPSQPPGLRRAPRHESPAKQRDSFPRCSRLTAFHLS